MIRGFIASAFHQLAQHNGTWPAFEAGAVYVLLWIGGLALAWCAFVALIRIVKWVWTHPA